MFEAYLVTLAGLVAMQVSPGPNLMAVAGAALGKDRKTAVAIATGVATGVAVWVLLVAFGLGAIIDTQPALIVALKALGGGYLLYLGVRGLIDAWHGEGKKLTNVQEGLSVKAAWAKGFLVVMTNPKAALAWAAIATFLFGAGLTTWQVVAFAPIASMSAFFIYGTYAVALSTQGAVRAYRRFSRSIETVFGSIFSLMGASLLLSGLKDIRG